ncbi:class I SAM-dependent methyltransferase [Candidatus Woesearchaeota archaeon]|nr:class I SAM-dependent methyltransferase [Candidatus Woesearchaeota archaeon]
MDPSTGQENFLLGHYKRLLKNNGSDFRFNSLRKLVLRYVKGADVLDLGCGTGHMTKALREKGCKVTSVDTDPEMIRLARAYTGNQDSHVLKGEDLRKVGKRRFDTIIALDVIEHIEDDRKVLDNMHAVLKEDGRIIISVPCFQWLYGKRDKAMGHWRRYQWNELSEKVKNAGFQIKSMRYWNLLGFFPYAFSEKLLNKPINEQLRYRNRGIVGETVNKLLCWWLTFEGLFPQPFGITLFCVAEKMGK